MVPPERYAATARATARSILGAPPFVTPKRAPGALQRLADDVGHALVSALHWILSVLRRFLAHPVGHAAHAVFGGYAVAVLIVLGVLVVTLGCVLWTRRDRPGREERDGGTERAVHRRRSEALLDRAAAARSSGDLDLALRLRFEAGLEQLEARGVVRERRTLTTAAVAAQVRSTTFDELASVHTLVAYAGLPASGHDVDAAFARWPELVTAPRAAAGER
jgi:hypothetical protein